MFVQVELFFKRSMLLKSILWEVLLYMKIFAVISVYFFLSCLEGGTKACLLTLLHTCFSYQKGFSFFVL